jgi:ADP-ribose pyrophosphatase
MKKFTCQDVTVQQKENGYTGFFSINQYTLDHGMYRGGQMKNLTRECFERGHAVGVLAYDPWQDSIIFLEQFRIGAYAHIMAEENNTHTSEQNRQKTPWLVEIIAGIVEAGESCEDVAHREAQEEAGIELLALEPIGNFYSSPGGSSENTQLYCGCVNSKGVEGIYGLAEEGEDILVQCVSYSDAVNLLTSGALNNASSLISMQWLMLHHDEIQKKWQNNLDLTHKS